MPMNILGTVCNVEISPCRIDTLNKDARRRFVPFNPTYLVHVLAKLCIPDPIFFSFQHPVQTLETLEEAFSNQVVRMFSSMVLEVLPTRIVERAGIVLYPARTGVAFDREKLVKNVPPLLGAGLPELAIIEDVGEVGVFIRCLVDLCSLALIKPYMSGLVRRFLIWTRLYNVEEELEPK